MVKWAKNGVDTTLTECVVFKGQSLNSYPIMAVAATLVHPE